MCAGQAWFNIYAIHPSSHPILSYVHFYNNSRYTIHTHVVYVRAHTRMLVMFYSLFYVDVCVCACSGANIKRTHRRTQCGGPIIWNDGDVMYREIQR